MLPVARFLGGMGIRSNFAFRGYHRGLQTYLIEYDREMNPVKSLRMRVAATLVGLTIRRFSSA